jgi:hypothetical protein
MLVVGEGACGDDDRVNLIQPAYLGQVTGLLKQANT